MKSTVLLSGPKVAVTDYTVCGVTDYTAPKSRTIVVGGVVVTRPPRPHQDPSKTPRPQQTLLGATFVKEM